MFAKSSKFSLKGTLDNQMSQLAAMRISDPINASKRIILGEELLQLTTNGQLRKIIQLINITQDEDILFYFIVKMFHNSIVNGHLMISAYIIDQGYPYNSPVVPNALLDALYVVDDFRAISILEYLVLIKGFDINSQVIRLLLCVLLPIIELILINVIATSTFGSYNDTMRCLLLLLLLLIYICLDCIAIIAVVCV